MSDSSTGSIEVKNIYKIFGTRSDNALSMLKAGASKQEILAKLGCNVGLNNVSLHIPAGKIFVIMGLSGSGKSTLVRHFNRLIEPTSGEILVDGQNVLKLEPSGIERSSASNHEHGVSKLWLVAAQNRAGQRGLRLDDPR